MANFPIQIKEVPLIWVGLDELPVQTATHFVVQISGPEELIFTIGHVAPPMLTGTPEQQIQQAESVAFVQGRPIARVGLTTNRIRELIKLLEEALVNHQRATGQAEEPS